MISVLYITRINFFSKRAHVYTTTQTCSAISYINEISITLISSDDSLRSRVNKESFFHSLNLKNTFSITSLNSTANKFKNSSNKWMYRVSLLLSNFSLIGYMYKNKASFDVVYVRDHQLFIATTFAKLILKKVVIFESHFVLTKKISQFFVKYIARISSGVVAITKGLENYYKVYTLKTVVAYCAASETDLVKSNKKNILELREELSLPEDSIIICYTGNMAFTGTGHSYGIEDIISTLPRLHNKYIFVGVGKKLGEDISSEVLAKKIGVSSRAIFRNWVDRREVAKYLLAADILVIPSSGAQLGNSPTKMFEYLGFGKPIVAANTEPISEILIDGKNALLVDYKNPSAWADAFIKVTEDLKLKNELVNQALKDAEKYTWLYRGKIISDFIVKTYQEVNKI